MRKRPIQVFVLLAAAAAMAMAQKAAKSQAEQDAITEIVKAKKPAEVMAKVDDFVVKFPDSEFKSAALLQAAKAADVGSDVKHAESYGDLAIEADPKNSEALLLVAGELAQHTKADDLDKTAKLAKAEKYANQALAVIPTAVKPSDKISDAEWEADKKTAAAGGHYDLGLVNIARGKAAAAAAEYQMAVDSVEMPDPIWLVRLGDAYRMSGKNDQAIAALDKVLANPDVLPQVKQVATNEKAAAEKAKGGK